MNEFLIKQYIANLSFGDNNNFASSNGVSLNHDETEIIYNNIKNNWRTIIYGNPRGILNDLKDQLEPDTYIKIEELYVSLKINSKLFIIISNIFD